MSETRKELEAAIRVARSEYDRLDLGDKATLRRCRDADAVALEPAFWRVASKVPPEKRVWFADVVACFPMAKQLKRGGRFRLGAFLCAKLHPGKKAVKASDALRFRRLVQARDRAELVHRLRALLKLAAGTDGKVDWGVVGADVLAFFYESGHVPRTWAQDYYTPNSPPPAATPDRQEIAHD